MFGVLHQHTISNPTCTLTQHPVTRRTNKFPLAFNRSLPVHLPRKVGEDVLPIEAVDSGILREVRAVSVEHLLPGVEQHVALDISVRLLFSGSIRRRDAHRAHEYEYS